MTSESGRNGVASNKEGCSSARCTHIEFDLKDYPVIFFRNMKELKDLLEKRLRGLADARSKLA